MKFRSFEGSRVLTGIEFSRAAAAVSEPPDRILVKFVVFVVFVIVVILFWPLEVAHHVTNEI